ncbi:MAG: winged-helix domain-containing protein, partial [Methylicorpusculum sp.]|nr:winged-helix domain-containing protein [Methylicorpusculum sp.]
MTLKSKNKKTTFKASKDPYAAREAAKYENPIPSRELILELIGTIGKPLSREEISGEFDLADEEQVEALRRRLRAMERDGQLMFNRRQNYFLVDGKDLIAGRILGHSDGFGFLRPDDGSPDLFLSPREMRSLMHNDRALVRVSGVDRKGRKEGTLVEVLERNTKQVVGRFFHERGVSYVVPENKNIAQDVLI